MFRQVADPTSEWKPTATAERGAFPEPADIVCGQQCTDGDITLWADEEVGEPKPEESGQGKTVSVFAVEIVGGIYEVTGAFRCGT